MEEREKTVLYNIAFQDNIYILLRQIDTINNGLKLDLESSLFGEKIAIDIAFFDKSIKALFAEILKATRLPNFVEVLHCMHFCITRYVDLINSVAKNKSFNKYLNRMEKPFSVILKEHNTFLKTIKDQILKNEEKLQEQEMVSTNELTELLSV